MAMKQKEVISRRFPYLPITLTVGQHTQTVSALLDTGFDGHVVVPAGLITNGNPPDSYLRWTLADGSQVPAPAYLGTVQIGDLGTFPAVISILGEEPIVGRSLSNHFRITLDHGKRVIVQP